MINDDLNYLKYILCLKFIIFYFSSDEKKHLKNWINKNI